ncbi:hypothetical protein [Paraclostridium bifermentans]|uniref:hypothetical protein n=1 Tax=Paraclostridium bifermentans TaxID=1490 RepID=UPI00241F8F12|nr:hypothetical protein [Paraclostridium bifermentans]
MNTISIEIENAKERANELYSELEHLKEEYNLKRCTKCNTYKSIHEFGKGKKETMCIECRREYNRKKYQDLVSRANGESK